MKKTGSGEDAFSGFSRQTVDFFVQLARHNNREWFEQNRQLYDSQVVAPARRFVTAMGQKIKTLCDGIRAEPRVNGSLFRIYRDMRFSADKSPYKTNLGIYFWEGNKPRLESSGFYFHLEPPRMLLGGGVYIFSPPQLHRFRTAAVDPESGQELREILDGIVGLKNYQLGGKHFRRIPAGYDPHHPNSDLLLHNGLWIGNETAIPKAFFSADLVDYCWEKFHPLAPLHQWLVAILR